MAEATCRRCGKAIRLKPAFINPAGNYCGAPCYHWDCVERDLDARNPTSMQIRDAAVEVGRQQGLPPAVGSLRLLSLRIGISEPMLSYYIRGKQLQHPRQSTVDRLRRMAAEVLGQSLHWHGSTLEHYHRHGAAAQDGAKRFTAQTDRQRTKIYAKRVKAQRGRARPGMSAVMRLHWADPQWKQSRLAAVDTDALRDRAKLLRTRLLANYGQRKRKLRRPLTVTDRREFIVEQSKKFHLPARWIRSVLDAKDGKRGRGQPINVDRYDRILRCRRPDGRIDWDLAVTDVAKAEGLVLATPGKRAAFRESLQASFWRAQRSAKPHSKNR